MRLSELKTGESATIVKVMGHGGFRRRIMEMGFVRGQRVEVILNAPLKDPIEYKIMGYDISLRRSEADMVVVLTDDEAGEYLARREHHRHHSAERFPRQAALKRVHRAANQADGQLSAVQFLEHAAPPSLFLPVSVSQRPQKGNCGLLRGAIRALSRNFGAEIFAEFRFSSYFCHIPAL